ncbi:hypothetical protein L3X38_017595 [Prunus dulcis]|uniref:Uncharacterized protein n=1 Tax=Prunus dulcis TaxID=3755 RepID=A0AAD4W7L5_PRUDU|nr:hypothetical protein L3X38_017595 [Prunus dulcis]
MRRHGKSSIKRSLSLLLIPQNVRLGLATDGFNPYGVLNQQHSTWPIFVFPYNLQPWKCMKKEYMMMTILITEDPGRSMDVYLACPVCKEDVTSGRHARKFVTLVIGDGCHETTSGRKKIKSSTGAQSIASDLENVPVMRSWNSLTVWILLRSGKQLVEPDLLHI